MDTGTYTPCKGGTFAPRGVQRTARVKKKKSGELCFTQRVYIHVLALGDLCCYIYSKELTINKTQGDKSKNDVMTRQQTPNLEEKAKEY